MLQLVFEGIRGKSFHGDIAIDDVVVTPGACSGAGGMCDFESDTCEWVNTQRKDADDFDWLRTKGGTTSQFTGPSSDHTKVIISVYKLYGL